MRSEQGAVEPPGQTEESGRHPRRLLAERLITGATAAVIAQFDFQHGPGLSWEASRDILAAALSVFPLDSLRRS